jgi:urease accessory protein
MMQMTLQLHRAGLLCLLLLWPTIAYAHLLSDEAGGLVSGFKHPMSGLDHVVAMVSVGLWGAQLGAPAIWLLPVAFPMVMAFGGMLGLMGVPLPGAEIGIALSAIGLGGAVATGAQPPLWIAALLVGFFAIFHGHAHGTELPADENGILYSVGFVVATGLLHLAGVGIGLIHRWKPGQLILRTGGVGVTIAGTVFLWNALT